MVSRGQFSLSSWTRTWGAAHADAHAGELAGYKLLVTSVRTGDTEVFIVDPSTGDAWNISRSPTSEDHYPCWSSDGKQVAFISDRAGSPNPSHAVGPSFYRFLVVNDT